MNIGTTTETSNSKAAKIQNYLSIITMPVMIICLLLQCLCFNIVVHGILCSAIIALYVGQLVCCIIQDNRRDVISRSWFIALWGVNLLISLIDAFM